MTFSKNPGISGKKGSVTFSYSKVLSLMSPLLKGVVTFSRQIGFCHFCHRQPQREPPSTEGGHRDEQ